VDELEAYRWMEPGGMPDAYCGGGIAEELGLPFGHSVSPGVGQFVMIERLTGVRLTREWLLETPSDISA
jgi:hypothetical protein